MNQGLQEPNPSNETEIPGRDYWEEIYAARDEGTAPWFQEGHGTSLAMIAASDIDQDASIIDVGGGDSRLVDLLLGQGFSDITVLDVAGTGLDRSRVRLKSHSAYDPDTIKWIAADITQWTPPRKYSLWHDRAVFHFLSKPEDRAAYRAALLAATDPGATIVIASFALDGPDRCSGLHVVRYGPDEITVELGPEFELREARKEVHTTPGGTDQNFHFFRFERV